MRRRIMPRLRYLHPDAGNCASPAVHHQVEDHLSSPHCWWNRRVRSDTDRRLRYAFGDLRGHERRQRLDGSQRHPARSDCVHVVLLLRRNPDTRRACGLHTHRLWQSHADPDGDTNGDGNSYRHSDDNSYCHTDGHGHSTATATATARPRQPPQPRQRNRRPHRHGDRYGYCHA